MRKTLQLSLLLVLTTLAVFGQSESGKAALEGRILDPTGQSVSNATVTALSPQTGYRRQVSSDGSGDFRLSGLPVGLYEVEATANGFANSRVTGIELTVGQTRIISVTLSLASVSTEVTVEGSALVVSQADIHNSVTLNERTIQDLPIRGRNFTEFVQLSPGVMQEQNRYGIVYNGQRSINANVSLDGVDFSDSLQGGSRGGGANESAFFFPQLAIREFQIVRSGVSAEIGRTNSGYLNVVTKSGSNDIHAAGYYSNRNGGLTSPDAFGNDLSTNAQNQFGASFGGPVKKDKTFYFGAIEKNLVTIPYTVKFDKPTGGVVVPSDIAGQEGTVEQINNPLVAFGRVDHQINERTSLNVQYTYAAQYGLNFGGISGGTTNQAASSNTLLDRASQAVKWGLTTVASASTLNELRGQYAYDNRLQLPNSPTAEVDINDLGVLGGAKAGNYIYNATRWQLLDSLSINKSRHNIKMGFDLNFNPQQHKRESNYAPIFIDSSRGTSFTGRVARPDPSVGQINLSKAPGHSRYDGLQMNLERRMSRRLMSTPDQINAQVHSGLSAGPQPVIVTTAGGASVANTITVNQAQPGLLAVPAFRLAGRTIRRRVVSGRSYLRASRPRCGCADKTG